MAPVQPAPAEHVTLRRIEEEIANGVTHGIGLLLSVGGLCALLVLTIARGNVWHVVGCTVYGSSLVILYTASTLYHSFRNPRIKQVLRTVDHAAIFLLIAGTYTPFTLVNLRGPWGWTLFAVVWTLAILGIVGKIIFGHRFEWISLSAYLAMGWLCVIAARPIMDTVPTGALWWLLAGGVAYTVGTIFYAADRRVPYFHAVWHVFVILGSVFHFLAVMFYVVPMAV